MRPQTRDYLLPGRLVAYMLPEALLGRRAHTTLRLDSLVLIKSRCVLHGGCVRQNIEGLLQGRDTTGDTPLASWPTRGAAAALFVGAEE